MVVTAASLKALAQACLNQANALQKMQEDLNYQGPQIAPLYANETALRSKVLLLSVAGVSAALAESEQAQDQLKNGTDAANSAVKVIKKVQDALQISADLISLAASAASGNPDGIISAGSKLVQDAGNLKNDD